MSRNPHTFSKRTAWDLGASEFALSGAAAKTTRSDLLDLTRSNPTICGFDYDADAILGPFADRRLLTPALIYDPDARGLRSAREAVAGYYADHRAAVDPDALILTTSTSEAYSYLFRLLCDAGDEVLVAQPSYPLFDFLADLDDVRLKTYPLFYDFGWWIDFAELERSISPKTRAILVVHPNNPTGHWTHLAERHRLEAVCERHHLALIVDEVFLDYPLAENPAKSFATGPHPALTFVLSGISKIIGLPQMKVAWIAAFGPAEVLREAMARLEIISDTFLSLNAPAQLALPRWLAGREGLRGQIVARVRQNHSALSESGMEVFSLEAGWSALLRVRDAAIEPGTTAAETLLSKLGVIVHPGVFYGLEDKRVIVISLLTPQQVFQSAIDRFFECVAACLRLVILWPQRFMQHFR